MAKFLTLLLILGLVACTYAFPNAQGDTIRVVRSANPFNLFGLFGGGRHEYGHHHGGYHHGHGFGHQPIRHDVTDTITENHGSHLHTYTNTNTHYD